MDNVYSLDEGMTINAPPSGASRLSAKIWTVDPVVSAIFPFVDVDTALSFSMVNRTAWAASNSNDYWAGVNTLGRLWERSDGSGGKELVSLDTRRKYLENSPHKLSVRGMETQEVRLLMDRIKCMSMAELRRSLALCRVDISMCIEKMDYRRHLQAALTFEDSLRNKGTGVFTRHTQLSFPEWALRMSDGKASYFHAKKESKRQFITRGELVNSEWAFHFKYAQDQLGNIVLAEMLGQVEKYSVRFFDDDTLTSSMHEHRMRFTYELGAEAGSNRMTSYQEIRVEQYPPLIPMRLASGMWKMESQHVIMEQKCGLSEIPLL